MWSRNALLATLFILTIMLGAWILLDQRTANLAAHFQWAAITNYFNVTLWAAKSAEIFTDLTGYTIYFLALLGENRELLFHGAIALFGILMVGLAIGSATSDSRNKTEAMLELLKQEKGKAESLAKLKAEFLNQVSHELRTPLAVIIGYLECITDGLYGEIEAKHHDILQVVSKQSNHLKNMIDQILIFSRLEASRQPIRIEEFSVPKVLHDLKETFEFLCKQKGLVLQWNVPKDITTLKSDPDRFKEILSNLLQNAVKYTDRGSITITLRGLSATDSVLLEVADTGMGIPEKYLPTIFEPFIQAHKTSSENSRGGIGLGLSIVKKHVEQIKGTITVESELGKGSTFRIILPRIYEERRSRHGYLFSLLKVPRRIKKKSGSLAHFTAQPRRPETTTRAAG
jgi:signal transduction histidine kinase